MSPERLFSSVRARVASFPAHEQWFELMKRYFAYMVTVDQVQEMCLASDGIFNSPESFVHLENNLSWFRQYTPCASVEELVDSQRPFIWKLEDLQREFADDELKTFFVIKDVIDYSKAEQLPTETADHTLWNVDWLEEYGLIQVDSVMFSRTVQPMVAMTKNAVDSVSESVLLAFPVVEPNTFATVMRVVPAMGGGNGLSGKFAPMPFNPNYLEAIGLSGVNTVMCFTEYDAMGILLDPYSGAVRNGHGLFHVSDN